MVGILIIHSKGIWSPMVFCSVRGWLGPIPCSVGRVCASDEGAQRQGGSPGVLVDIRFPKRGMRSEIWNHSQYVKERPFRCNPYGISGVCLDKVCKLTLKFLGVDFSFWGKFATGLRLARQACYTSPRNELLPCLIKEVSWSCLDVPGS